MPLVLREDSGGLAVLTLNRPEKMNALNIPLFAELQRHVAAIEADRDIQVVALRGAGRCFSAGHDLSDISDGEALPHPHFQSKVIECLAGLPQPVVVVVHGVCFTGALELALAGDLILASTSAKFADTHARFALTPIWGLSQRLPRRVGTYKAREMMLTCQPYSGTQAKEMGLANFCVPDDALDEELAKLTATIMANSSFSHAANKRLLTATDGLSLAAGLAHEVYQSEGIGPDMQERIARFASRKDSPNNN